MIKKILSLMFAVCLIISLIAIPVSAKSSGGGKQGPVLIPSKTFTVPLEGTEFGAKVILALYEVNVLSDIQIATYEGEAVSFESNAVYDNIKVFVWSEDGIEPLSGELCYSQIIYGEDDVLDIDMSLIKNFYFNADSLTGIMYYDEAEGSFVQLSLDSDTVCYYNGRRMKKDEALAYLRKVKQYGEPPHYGWVKTVKGGAGDNYSILYITEFYNDAVVKGIDKANKRITSYINNEVFDFNKNGVEYLIYKEDGSYGSFDDINYDSVLSFAKSADGSLVSVYISNKKATGDITEKINHVMRFLYQIGGIYYKGNEEYGRMERGDEGTFYINANNTIVYKKELTSFKYAFLYGAMTDTDNKVYIKYLKSNGMWEIGELANNVTVSKGVNSAELDIRNLPMSALDVIAEIFDVENGKIKAAKRQLIHYEKDSNGKISHLYVANDTADNNSFSLDFSDSAAVYSEKNRNIGALRVKYDTKVFCIDITKANTEEGYYVSTVKHVFKDGDQYKVNGYDKNSGGYPAAILTEAPFESPGISIDTPILVVDRVIYGAEVKSGDDVNTGAAVYTGDTVYTVTGYNNGKEFSANCIKGLRANAVCGDIVLCSLNSAGEICKIETLFEVQKVKEYIELGNHPIFVCPKPEEEYNYCGQVVLKRSNNGVRFELGENYYLTGSKLKIYTVNLNRKRPVISPSTYADITANTERGTLGSWLFVRYVNGEAIGAVAYQKDIV